jgi:hypothetical protein
MSEQATTLVWPRRMKNRELARERYGEVPARLVPYLERSDSLADAAIEALRALPAAERELTIESALNDGQGNVVPVWLDDARLQRAHEVFLRAGLLGGISLGLCSLVHGYAAPAGNKPLAFSGRLKERADRRLAETGRFVTDVTEPGGVRPGARGWRSVLRVRLMHAQVRRLLLDSDRSTTGLTPSTSTTCWRQSCCFLACSSTVSESSAFTSRPKKRTTTSTYSGTWES